MGSLSATGLILCVGLVASARGRGPIDVWCPDGALPEGEPGGHGECDPDTPDVNAGCFNFPLSYTDVACGTVVCGVSWAEGGVRDLDNFQVLHTEAPLLVQATIVAEFPVIVYLWENDPCEAWFPESVVAGPGETADLSLVSPFGPTFALVAHNGYEGLPCGVEAPLGNDYVIEFSCSADIRPDPCPGLGDVDGDGLVGFDDLLIVVANFGDCPG